MRNGVWVYFLYPSFLKSQPGVCVVGRSSIILIRDLKLYLSPDLAVFFRKLFYLLSLCTSLPILKFEGFVPTVANFLTSHLVSRRARSGCTYVHFDTCAYKQQGMICSVSYVLLVQISSSPDPRGYGICLPEG